MLEGSPCLDYKFQRPQDLRVDLRVPPPCYSLQLQQGPSTGSAAVGPRRLTSGWSTATPMQSLRLLVACSQCDGTYTTSPARWTHL